MAYRLPENEIRIALRHICRYGDTDIFPHLPEIAFFQDKEDAIVAEIANLDLDSYSPTSSIEALAPKNRLSFRIAHQLPAADTLLLLSSIIVLAPTIEAMRPDQGGIESFSYRINIADNGQIFSPNRTFKNWLLAQKEYVVKHPDIVAIVATDISDFYSRINFHRLENMLDQVASGHGAARFIKKHIRAIRAKQSFGLPIGGSGARVLAELSLVDTDRALSEQGIQATRYVDDFRIFLTRNDAPYDVVGFLAQHLGINEGLSLNAGKTEIRTRDDFLTYIERITTDLSEQAEGVALESLTTELYFDEEPDPDEVAKLKSLNLIALLERELSNHPWDVGRIKVIFRALKITRSGNSIEFILTHFRELVIFAKDVCLLMDELVADDPNCFDDLLDDVIEAVLQSPASSVQLIRTWLLEIFVRRIIEIPTAKIRQLENLPSPLDRRQLLLIRGGRNDTNYFRAKKTSFDTFGGFEQPCLIWGASCLPDDEYETWLTTIRASFARPTGALFIQWAKEKKGVLISHLSSSRDDHPE